MTDFIPRCRTGLTPSDLVFIHYALARNGKSCQSVEAYLSDPEDRDNLLDNPALLDALLDDPGLVTPSPVLFFYLILRQMMLRAGWDDRELADYLATLLASFHRRTHGRPAEATIKAREAYFYVDEDMERLGQAGHYERFVTQIDLANKALWLTGLFGPHIEQRSRQRAAPDLAFYESVGRCHYRLAGEHNLAGEFRIERILHTLSDCFPETRQLLTDCGRRWLFLGSEPGCN